MLGKWVKVLWLGVLLSGLCPATQANTTRLDGNAPSPTEGAAVPPVQLVRIGLLLPLRSETLGRAADAVRAGFLAAYEREPDGIVLSVIETDETAQDALAGYATLAVQHDIVIGPLSRSGVTALAQRGKVSKPTIALGQLDATDAPGNAEAALPEKMLFMGLSIEDEARQIANWAGTDAAQDKAFVVSTGVAWQRRAAKAFAVQWQRKGLEAQSMELSASGGLLEASGIQQLKKRIQGERPDLLFVALDAAQARQVRNAIGSDIALYGTSQLNPLALPDWKTAEPVLELNGVRLLDIPWQLQADHPAVMTYPRLDAGGEQKRSADMERLYALGVDAYRVARLIAAQRTTARGTFELDGVTGKLRISFGQGASRFERIAQPAVYRDGTVTTLPGPGAR